MHGFVGFYFLWGHKTFGFEIFGGKVINVNEIVDRDILTYGSEWMRSPAVA
jgi:hypothetical protein